METVFPMGKINVLLLSVLSPIMGVLSELPKTLILMGMASLIFRIDVHKSKEEQNGADVQIHPYSARFLRIYVLLTKQKLLDSLLVCLSVVVVLVKIVSLSPVYCGIVMSSSQLFSRLIFRRSTLAGIFTSSHK